MHEAIKGAERVAKVASHGPWHVIQGIPQVRPKPFSQIARQISQR